MEDALRYASRIAYSSKEVLQFTYDQAVKYKDAPGVYVECGVAAGAQIIAMAAGAPNKTIYAFDSFEGIPLPSNKDNQMPGIRMLTMEEQLELPNPGEQVLESSGATSVSVEDFVNHLVNSGVNFEWVFWVVGWFEESLPKWLELHSDTDIAILRLDGDLYNSTYVCLQNLYPKVIKGGIVIIDDWALSGCRAAVEQYFDDNGPPDWYWYQAKVSYITDKNSTVAYWTK